MGFSSILDIIGAMLVGSMLFLILLRLNGTAVQYSYDFAGDSIVQKNLVEVVQLLEHDFRKIGYCEDWTEIPDPTKSILLATQESIKFLTDTDSDGNVDTMFYYLGPASELTVTVNPDDRLLYRVVNNDVPIGVNLGVTQFELEYFNALGDTLNFPISVPAEIYTMQINISVQSTAAYDDNYSTAFWRQIRLAARNLKNR